MESLSTAFIRHIKKVAEDAVSSSDAIHQLKRCVLDWLGVSFAGAASVENKFNALLEIAGDGVCSTFLSSKRKDIVSAASLNGFISHVMELDDGHRFGMLHLESPIVSAMVAVAQKEKLDFIHFAKGIVAGYQATVQVARYIQPYHKQKGYHATGTCGTIGVAMAIATALDFSDKQFENALAAATTRASGLLSVIDSPSEMKPFNVAGAVENGIRAAYLALAGVQGPVDPLLGKRGFLRVYSPETGVREDIVMVDTPEILGIYFKPYISCRHCHAPAEAALNLHSRYSILWNDVKAIQVETYLLAIGGHDNQDIRSISAAKMSIPYCVSASLIYGSCGLHSFTDDAIQDQKIKALMTKVQVVEDPELTRVSPGKRGARVIVTLNDGSCYTCFVENPLGEPEHPMSDRMLEEKFWELVSFAGVDKHYANTMVSTIWHLESEFYKFLGLL